MRKKAIELTETWNKDLEIGAKIEGTYIKKEIIKNQFGESEKYVIETKDTVLYKVLDMDSNVLFEGTEKYSSIYVGVDGELYVFCYGYLIGATYDVALYRIEDKELVEVVVLDGEHDSHTEILYTDKKGNVWTGKKVIFYNRKPGFVRRGVLT